MKCNIVFSEYVERVNEKVIVEAPTFTFYSKYMPTLFSFGISITFTDFEQLEGNVFGISIVNSKTTDVIYATSMKEPVPSVEDPQDSITLTAMLNNLEIQNESSNTLFVFFNDELIGQSNFVVKQGGNENVF